jgi:hypothetical protein
MSDSVRCGRAPRRLAASLTPPHKPRAWARCARIRRAARCPLQQISTPAHAVAAILRGRRLYESERSAAVLTPAPTNTRPEPAGGASRHHPRHFPISPTPAPNSPPLQAARYSRSHSVVVPWWIAVRCWVDRSPSRVRLRAIWWDW